MEELVVFECASEPILFELYEELEVYEFGRNDQFRLLGTCGVSIVEQVKVTANDSLEANQTEPYLL